jgi:alpha-acetolactate decarboxylase
LALSACSSPPSLEIFGSLHETMMGGAAPAVELDRLDLHNAIAVGALSELRGEITVVDRRIWTAYPDGAGVRVVDSDASTEKAALLVVARPKEWRELAVSEDVAPASVGSYLVERARALGWDVTKPTAVRIDGPLVALDWHVVDGSQISPGADHAAHMQAARRGHLEKADATLVGFVSTEHAGVITHVGEVAHLHLVDGAKRLTGHVDAVGLAKAARVRLGQ